MDSENGKEHRLTIHSVRKSDEGEYGVLVEDTYTAITRISVVGMYTSVKLKKWLALTPLSDSDTSELPTEFFNNRLIPAREFLSRSNKRSYIPLHITKKKSVIQGGFELPSFCV